MPVVFVVKLALFAVVRGSLHTQPGLWVAGLKHNEEGYGSGMCASLVLYPRGGGAQGKAHGQRARCR